MAETFNKGDTVRLKSGGPVMTVTEVGNQLGSPTVWTVWFEKTSQKTGSFPPEALEKASPPSSGATFGRVVRG